MLEKIAARIIGNGSLLLIAYVLATFVSGFIVALIIKRRSNSELQRVPYFVYSIIVFNVVVAVSFTWLWSMKAAAEGLLWVVVLVNFATVLFAGYFSGILAAARARDAFGSSLSALIALIPVLNLLLLFQPSRDPQSSNHVKTIPVLKGWAGLALGIFLLAVYGALLTTLSMQKERMLEEAKNNPHPKQGIEFMLRARGLERTLQVMADEGNKMLPRRIDEVTSLATLSAKGTHLLRTYIIDRDDVTLPSDFRKRVETYICSFAPFQPLLREGATIEEVYKQADGTLIAKFAITQETCDKRKN